jgi:hypothetical protein
MKFRKKPVEIEAVQFTGTNGDEIAEFMGCQHPCIENGALLIGTLEGVMRVYPCDWIIKGITGEFYPCKPEIFRATYDKVADTPRLQERSEG